MERRKYLRLEKDIKVVYKVIDKLGEYEISTRDMGGGGLNLLLNERLEQGTLLELSITLPEEKQPFFALVKVAWQKSEPTVTKDSKIYYETGVEFLKLDLKHRLSIIHHVYSERGPKKI